MSRNVISIDDANYALRARLDLMERDLKEAQDDNETLRTICKQQQTEGQRVLLEHATSDGNHASTEAGLALQLAKASGDSAIAQKERAQAESKRADAHEERAGTLQAVQPWDPLESTCRHASLSIL